MLPNARERRQIFYWLKRISSYTAWNRILDYYRAWASATERSVQVASERGWLRQYDRNDKLIGGAPTDNAYFGPFTGSAIDESRLVEILKGLAHCEEGVGSLRAGDKRVFQYNAHGKFVMARSILSYWSELQWRIEIGENGIDQDHTPHWDEFCFALTELSEAWAECSSEIIEPERLDAASHTFFNDNLKAKLEAMVFPKVLPEVPDPITHTLVGSGRRTPHSGIWEPVNIPKPKGFQLFGMSPLPEGPFESAGTMAYLHADSSAPHCAAYGEAKGKPTVWRLLWRDDRYEDGTIPEEERGYVFQQPDPARLAPEPEELRGGMRVWSDEPCPYPGVWKCLDDLTLSPQTVAFGIPMPRLQGRRVMWRFMKAV